MDLIHKSCILNSTWKLVQIGVVIDHPLIAIDHPGEVEAVSGLAL